MNVLRIIRWLRPERRGPMRGPRNRLFTPTEIEHARCLTSDRAPLDRAEALPLPAATSKRRSPSKRTPLAVRGTRSVYLFHRRLRPDRVFPVRLPARTGSIASKRSVGGSEWPGDVHCQPPRGVHKVSRHASRSGLGAAAVRLLSTLAWVQLRYKSGYRPVCVCGDGGNRTLTVGVLSALPLPVGLRPRDRSGTPARDQFITSETPLAANSSTKNPAQQVFS